MVRGKLINDSNEFLNRTNKELEALLRALSNSAVISETNADGTITFVNDLFVDISKYSREELIGKNHKILKSGEHSKAFYENLWSTISRGRIWRGMFKNKAKDGTFYWVDSSIVPILDNEGKPAKYVSVRFLVTEREEAIEELNIKIKQLDALAYLGREAMTNPDILSLFELVVGLLKKTLNIDLVAILKLLPGGKSLLYETGMGMDDAIKGKTVISAEESQTMAAYTFRQNVPTVVEDLTTESRFVGSDLLHDHNARSGVCVIIHGSESPFGVLQVYSTKKRIFSPNDVNFIQSVANLLASSVINQLDKKKDEFLGIASHEIKTPLTSIKTFSQLLSRHVRKQKDEKAVLYLSKIDQQINRMTDLIGGLLDISRINIGRVDYKYEEFDLSELIKNIINEIQLTTEKHKILFENKMKLKIRADKQRIGQIITNLLMNAIKFSPKSEKIIVKIEKDENFAIVSVQDFGIGIAEKEQNLIFERFYQADGERKYLPGGLGLGLYISATIIKHHKGRIWVESAVGKGSTFYFTLPFANNINKYFTALI